jgi:hypothetical protein
MVSFRFRHPLSIRFGHVISFSNKFFKNEIQTHVMQIHSLLQLYGEVVDKIRI